ncbi:D-amino-acid transaminase [Bauldia litoralis]|uniref:Probable branched-chain-amino-acid aminotransferase n=1 Tax=Bauldia litoralis TaxID=665467 RepID=A0A1G6AZP4_9HYPH|nr:D-amino-acid transaminase [Bauldia litoralis]SDB13749.1 D-alanine aminotransferase apoenzyme [Bauldia litoralis]
MSRIAYVNGRYLPHGQAGVHIEDRGFQFADAVYEVCEVKDGLLVDEGRHLQRLTRSLSEIRMAEPRHPAALGAILREVVRRNRVRNGIVYLQVTRGVAPRNHPFPNPEVAPGLIVTARSINPAEGRERARTGIAVITTPDNRWERVDIKSVGLLPNVLAKQKAREAGAFEAWFIDENDYITEGSSTNAWIVTGEGVLVTRPADHSILRGVTRMVVLETAEDLGMTVEERPFTLAEVRAGREAFITASSTLVMPVVKVDGETLGDGLPGPVAIRLRSVFHDHADYGRNWASLTK